MEPSIAKPPTINGTQQMSSGGCSLPTLAWTYVVIGVVRPHGTSPRHQIADEARWDANAKIDALRCGATESHPDPVEAVMECIEFDLEWNPIGTAPAHSALAGVLAGLVFGGIVVLFSDRNQSRQRMRALMLFSGALVVLAFDSFLFGVVAGERVCAKAWTATMQAGGLLGLGALGIFGGISWLFNTYDDRFQQATRLARHITYTVALIVGFHLQLNAKSYLTDMQAMGLSDPPGWLERAVDLYIWLIIVIIVAFPLLRWMAPRFQRRAALGHGDAGENPGESANQRLDRKVRTAAYLSVGYVVLVAGATGVMLGWTKDQWEPTTPTSVVASATLLSLAVPTLALVAQLLSLPTGVTTTDGITGPVVPGSIPDQRDGGRAVGASAVDERPAAAS